jgi:hypothetical protein
VFVAYSILHLDSLPPPSRTGKGKRPTTPSKTIGEVCRQQAQALIEQLILFAHDRLEQGTSAAEVFTRISHKGVKSGVKNLRECNYHKASSGLNQ